MNIILWGIAILYGAFNVLFGLFLMAAFVGQRFFNRRLEEDPTPVEEKLAA